MREVIIAIMTTREEGRLALVRRYRCEHTCNMGSEEFSYIQPLHLTFLSKAVNLSRKDCLDRNIGYITLDEVCRSNTLEVKCLIPHRLTSYDDHIRDIFQRYHLWCKYGGSAMLGYCNSSRWSRCWRHAFFSRTSLHPGNCNVDV